MPTKAYVQFLKNIDTVDRLCETYNLVKSQRATRGRAAFDHITRSAIIFLASAFEVYIEDSIKECCKHNISFAKDADKLPHDIKGSICEYVKKDGNKTSPIELCDEGWRKVYTKMADKKTEKLNTPKTRQLIEMFSSLIGISENQIKKVDCINKLDAVISFRGEIAHRGRADAYVKIDKVKEERETIMKIVKSIDKTILWYFKTTNKNKRLPWNDTY